jgi:hypothetical protein
MHTASSPEGAVAGAGLGRRERRSDPMTSAGRDNIPMFGTSQPCLESDLDEG